jgi:4-amino-4-deoxy-L-arabinose transferase-like glycosyltransferase
LGLAGLGDSEAYYWTWSKNLDLSYFDHPPAVAYMIRLGTSILGDTPFGVRVVPTLITTSSLFVVYLAGEALAGALAGLMSMLVLLAMPLFIVGGVAAAPDAPKALFTCLALLLFIKARKISDGVKDDPAARFPVRADLCVIFAGLFFGLGFLAKYSTLMLLPGLVAALLLTHNRRWWSRPSLYIGIALCLAATLPVIIWNARGGWASVTYHLVSRQGGAGLSFANLGKLLGGQIAYFSPFILTGFVLSVMAAWRARKTNPLPFEISLIGVPAVLFFYGVILVTPNAEPHWPLGGYLFLSVVLGWALASASKPVAATGLSLWHGLMDRWSPPVRFAVAGALFYSLFIVLVAHVHILTPAFVKLMPASYNPKLDLVNELYGWDTAGEHIAKVYEKEKAGGGNPFLLGYHYTFCSQLMFSTGAKIELQCLTHRRSQFNYFPEALKDLNGRTAVYVNDNRYTKTPDDLYYFDSCSKADRVDIARGGHWTRGFDIYVCKGFRGMK